MIRKRLILKQRIIKYEDVFSSLLQSSSLFIL